MKQEAIARFDYPEELKEKLIELVVCQNYSKEEVAKKYGLVNTYILTNWIIGYREKIQLKTPRIKTPGEFSIVFHLILYFFASITLFKSLS